LGIKNNKNNHNKNKIRQVRLFSTSSCTFINKSHNKKYKDKSNIFIYDLKEQNLLLTPDLISNVLNEF
jgi:hypothetical protein